MEPIITTLIITVVGTAFGTGAVVVATPILTEVGEFLRDKTREFLGRTPKNEDEEEEQEAEDSQSDDEEDTERMTESEPLTNAELIEHNAQKRSINECDGPPRKRARNIIRVAPKPKKRKCDVCSFKTDDIDDMLVHRAKFHLEVPSFRCGYCRKASLSFTIIRRHEIGCHKRWTEDIQ